MSSAEMVIKLVDGTEEEQAAFDRSPMDATAVPSTETPSVQNAPQTNVALPTQPQTDSEATKTATDSARSTSTIDGLDAPGFKRLLDRLEAQALAMGAGDGSTEGKASQSATDQAASVTVGQVHEQLAEIAKGKSQTEGTQQADEQASDGPTRDDFRDLRQSMIDLAYRFTPKFFAEPIERLIAALAPRSEEKPNEPTPSTPPTTEGSKPADIPAVGTVAPKQEDKPEASEGLASVGDVLSKIQEHIGNIPFAGKRVNNVINSAKTQYKNVSSRVSKIGTKAAKAMGKTRVGRAVMAQASKAASFARNTGSRIASSRVGKAVSGVAQSAVSTAARYVGASAAGGAVASGGAGGVAASGGATAAGGVAVAAMANPVGLAVGAVVASFAALAVGAKLLNDTFSAEADKLEQYSASIAMARAKTQMNTEINMMDRANKIGGAMGGIESAKSALSNQTEKLWTEILTLLSSVFAPALQSGVELLTGVVGEGRKMVATSDIIAAYISKAVATFTPGFQDDMDADNSLQAANANYRRVERSVAESHANMDGTRDPELMDVLLNVRFDANGRLL